MTRTPRFWSARARRRGTALILVLLMTVTLAAIALSAILLTGSGTLLTKYYDREREFRYAAEAALAMGKAQLTRDTSLHLPDSGYVTLISGGQITGADGQVIPRVRVNLYAGLSGNTTGQFGQYASIIAEAYDAGGTRYVRRLELTAENFARYAMFTNHWPGVCYTSGEYIAGRGHSNENWVSCGSPTYYDTISAVNSVTGGAPDFRKPPINGAAYIPIPPVSRLAILHTRATDGHLDITPQGTNLATVATRVEFVSIDLNQDSTAFDADEGFIRVYQAADFQPPAYTPFQGGANFVPGLRAAAARTRVNPWNNGGVNSPPDDMCGDWHDVQVGGAWVSQFFPVAVHGEHWFKQKIADGVIRQNSSDQIGPDGEDNTWVDANSGASDNDRRKIMDNAGFRCYPAGDPHLVSIERRYQLPAPDSLGAWQKGGEDTTFTARTSWGSWQPFGGDQGPVTAALAAIPAGDRYAGYAEQAQYLWPLYKTLNLGSHGVIHVHGPVAINGILKGKVTLYAQTTGGQNGSVLLIDDLVYTQDPAAVLCANLFGLLADVNVMIADNAINSPQRAGPGGGHPYEWTDGNDNGMLTRTDFVFHGVTMSRTGTVGVENYSSHPEALKGCNGANSGRGCIRQAGGVIEDRISATFTNSGDGYGENRTMDACLSRESPPYFPTTGRYIDNRFYETDPARFDVASLFRSLQGGF